MKVTQAFTFEAAHRLPNVPDGHRCKNMHGHSYRIELTVEGEPDSMTGFVIDFFDIEKLMQPLLDILDHHTLNDVDGLDNPTVENIALWIKKWIKTRAVIDTVRVYETSMCWAEA